MVIGVGAFLSAIGGLAQGVQSSNAASAANNTNLLSLYETKRSNKKRENLARSDRPLNEFGSKVVYNPATKAFEVVLDDSTKRLSEGQRREDLLGIEKDAPRNRKIAELGFDRAKRGNDLFLKELNRFEFRPEINQKVFEGRAQREAKFADDKRVDKAVQALSRVSLRQGEGSSLAQLLQSAAQLRGDNETLTASRARKEGKSEFQQARANDEGTRKSNLDFLRAIAQSAPTVNVARDGTGLRGANLAGSALNSAINVEGQNNASLSNAFSRVASTQAQSGGSGIGAFLSALGRGLSGNVSTPVSDLDVARAENLRKRTSLLGVKPSGTTRSAGRNADLKGLLLKARIDNLAARTANIGNSGSGITDPRISALFGNGNTSGFSF